MSSSKVSLFLHAKAESSGIVIIPVMVTEAANFEEQLASMKATLDRLSRDSLEKDTQIKRQNEKSAELMKRLKKKSSKASDKGSNEEDSNKESNHDKEFENDRKARKDCSLGSMYVEQIQSLIANVVMAQFRGGSHKTYLYTKPYMKRIDSLRMVMAISLQNSISSMERATPNNILHISLKHAVMLELRETGW